MASRIFHVTPSSLGGWQVKVQRTSSVLGRFSRKIEALQFARSEARDFVSGRGERRSFVIAHDRLGRFATTIPFGA